MKKFKILSVLLALFLVSSILSACEFNPVSPDTPLTKAPQTTTVAPGTTVAPTTTKAQATTQPAVTTNAITTVDPNTQEPTTEPPLTTTQQIITTPQVTTTSAPESRFDLVADPTGNGYVPSLSKVRLGDALTKVKNLSLADYIKKGPDYERVLVELEGYAVSVNTENTIGVFYLLDTNGDSVYVYGCSKFGTEFKYSSMETGGYEVALTTRNATYTNLFAGGKGNFIENGQTLVKEGQYVKVIGIYDTYNGVSELHAELVGTTDEYISELGGIYTPKIKGDNITAQTDKDVYDLNESCTITITPDTNFAIKLVQLKRINGVIEELELTDGKVTFNVGYSDTLMVTAEDNALESGTKCATFEFGANMAAGNHKDGSALKDDYTETNGGYTLTITNVDKVYSKACDLKGNSCLKLGSSDSAASFSFTVANDVDYVIIYVAGYKANNGAVKINGVDYTITAQSNDGEYQAIKIDTRTTKTIEFATTSPGRGMLNTIEFYKIA